jgi:hypothetical protein
MVYCTYISSQHTIDTSIIMFLKHKDRLTRKPASQPSKSYNRVGEQSNHVCMFFYYMSAGIVYNERTKRLTFLIKEKTLQEAVEETFDGTHYYYYVRFPYILWLAVVWCECLKKLLSHAIILCLFVLCGTCNYYFISINITICHYSIMWVGVR